MIAHSIRREKLNVFNTNALKNENKILTDLPLQWLPTLTARLEVD